MLTRGKADTCKIMNYVRLRPTGKTRENSFKAYDLTFLFLDFLTCMLLYKSV